MPQLMINHLPPQKNLQMIATVSEEADTTPSWQQQLADVVTDSDELLQMLELSAVKASLYLPKGFGLRVPRSFVRKMQKGNINDPLLRQVLPNVQETTAVSGYVPDPLLEHAHNPISGLLHKYQSRVLLTVTGACAIHCRYCFRQHFDYQANVPKQAQLLAIQHYITAHPDINEVILSGGDPLSVSNRRLFGWLDALEALPQISTIRLHTRLPVVIPDRLEAALLTRLAASRCQIVMVIHSNHANEIDTQTLQALREASSYGLLLLNQAVLLKAVNNTLAAQMALSQRLFAAQVMPYYLHLLDKVAGAAHFDIHQQEAIELYWQLLKHLPGYLVPKLVQEVPSHPFKMPVDIFQGRSS